jgi:hypothetical protein
MYMMSIFTGICFIGAVVEAIYKKYFFKVDLSDLIGRLDSGEELSSCNMFGDNHKWIHISDSVYFYCQTCKVIESEWEVNNGSRLYT